jgi:uncharacterized protein (UPF0261 family)
MTTNAGGSAVTRSVVLVGTLDTKGREYAYVRDRLLAEGASVIVVDVGILGEPPFAPDVTAEQVAAAAGTRLDELRSSTESGDRRAAALATMERGAIAVVGELVAAGRVAGVMGLGGSGGSAVASGVLRSLPVGVPKLLVSTLASGDVRGFVGTSDLTLVYPITDVAGLNRVSRRVLGNAAAAMAGMARSALATTVDEPPLVGITMFGVTTQGVMRVQERLETAGFEVIVFHAVGSGGAAMEQMITDGLIDGVVDYTTTELADELLGGVFSAGPERLTAAGRRGIPQVVIPGALEDLTFGPRDTVPERFLAPERRAIVHSPTVTITRITRDESAELGRILAARVSAATGPSAVVLPLRGLSRLSAPGGPWDDPEADAAMLAAIRDGLRPGIVLREVDANANDPAFADVAADAFLELWTGSGRQLPRARP